MSVVMREGSSLHQPAPNRADRLLPLRERLRQADPELGAELDLQWQIASTEWLPTIPLSKDSSNAFPHLRNVESHLDETLATLHRHDPSAAALHMRPIEMYLMLASVLFHDIGRADLSARDHGRRSGEYLRKIYNSLGIRNRELAHSLGEICTAHTAGPAEREGLSLGDIVIDPYGEVRQRMIAALLTLADCMDSAQTRVVPDYLRSDKAVIGGFRNIIAGVFADPVARLVRTVLVPGDKDAKGDNGDALRFELNADAHVEPAKQPWKRRAADLAKMLGESEKAERWIECLNSLTAAATGGPADERGLARNRIPELLNSEEGFTKNLGATFGYFGRFPGVAKTTQAGKGTEFDLVEQLLTWSILQVAGNPKECPWKTLAAIVLGDVRTNEAILHSIRDDLAAVGLPLATWLVEYEERLYTPDCKETYEPLLHSRYLVEVARAMWDMSRGIVGTSAFTYSELASYLGDRDAAKVRMAVRRLAIAASKPEESGSGEEFPRMGPIWAGEQAWRWRVRAKAASGGCRFFPLGYVEGLLGDGASAPGGLVDPLAKRAGVA